MSRREVRMVRFIEAEASKTGRGEQFWLKIQVKQNHSGGLPNGSLTGPPDALANCRRSANFRSSERARTRQRRLSELG